MLSNKTTGYFYYMSFPLNWRFGTMEKQTGNPCKPGNLCRPGKHKDLFDLLGDWSFSRIILIENWTYVETGIYFSSMQFVWISSKTAVIFKNEESFYLEIVIFWFLTNLPGLNKMKKTCTKCIYRISCNLPII